MSEMVISVMRHKFNCLELLDVAMHNKMVDMFKKYLLVGGRPDVIDAYLEIKNIQIVRDIQNEIH